jgi:hypothetical protein
MKLFAVLVAAAGAYVLLLGLSGLVLGGGVEVWQTALGVLLIVGGWSLLSSANRPR